ncbi:MAG: ATP-dependent Clp protease adaptor ClpS [Bacteroidales bacterium]|nr:ATP-dependent Clp protease adaptor ClpS [Bacteroidales bacterium]
MKRKIVKKVLKDSNNSLVKARVKKEPGVGVSVNEKTDPIRQLILHNDEVNTFDHVINSLIEICEHNIVQAEQCAYITHYKGKCDVKSGSYKELSPKRLALMDRGLQVTID